MAGGGGGSVQPPMNANNGTSNSSGGGRMRERESDRWGPPPTQQQQQMAVHQAQHEFGSHARGDSGGRSAGRESQHRSPPRRRASPPRRQSPLPPPRRRSPSPYTMRRETAAAVPDRIQSAYGSSSRSSQRGTSTTHNTERERDERHGSIVSSTGGRRGKRLAPALLGLAGGSAWCSPRESSSRSPPRRRARVVPRYAVVAPKFAADCSALAMTDCRQRFSNMYVPSDFYKALLSWRHTFPLYRQFSLHHPTSYTITHKQIEPPNGRGEAPLEPADADYRYSAKVMLFGAPTKQELYKKVMGLQVDGVLNEEDTTTTHRNISFLVGQRGKGEVLSIGGAWSPSLDGANPDTDPAVLVRTAIRTTRTLTGIDLSACTQWYKFLELRYRRVDKEQPLVQQPVDASPDSSTENSNPLVQVPEPRLDTVVVFVPDVWSLMPSVEEHQATLDALKAQLAVKLAAIDQEAVDAAEKEAEAQRLREETYAKAKAEQEAALTAKKAKAEAAAAAAKEAAEKAKAEQEKAAADKQKATEDGKEADTTAEATDAGAEAMDVSAADTDTSAVTAIDLNATGESAADDSTVSEGAEGSGDGKLHWSKLIVANMKVAELREQLELRGLEKKGVKQILSKRLQDALDAEKAAGDNPTAPAAKADTDDIVMDMTAAAKSTAPDEPLPSSVAALLDGGTLTVRDEIKDTDDEVIESNKSAWIGESEEQKAAREKEEKRRREREEKDRKERKAALEKQYTVDAKAPCLFAFPHAEAKSGKFDCKLMSLHQLLEYRQDDNKEHSFEVNMFAEAFSQMLNRDNAFTVYKTLLAAPDKDMQKTIDEQRQKTVEAAARAKALAELEEEIAKELAPAPAEDKAMDTTEASSTEDAANEKETAVATEATPAAETVAASTIADDDEIKAIEPSKEEKAQTKRDKFAKDWVYKSPSTRTIIKHSDILASFVFWDVNQCGFIQEKDLEDIIYSTGLQLSRSQVSKLVRRFSSHDQVKYMPFVEASVLKDTAEEYNAPVWLNVPELQTLALGNTELEPVLDGAAPSATSQKKSAAPQECTSVLFEGSIVDVAGTLANVRKLEQAQVDMGTKNAALDKELKSIKEQQARLQKQRKRLDEDLIKYKKRLYDTEKSLKSSQDDTKQLKSAVVDVKKLSERVIGVCDKAIPPPPPPAPKKEPVVKKEEKKETVTPSKSTEAVSSKTESSASGSGSAVLNVSTDSANGSSAAAAKSTASADESATAGAGAASASVSGADDLMIADDVDCDPADPTQKH